MADRKLREWVEAGLIDEATAQRIETYESDNARPWILWAIVGLGALAISLGLISLVAANWQEIPGRVRLSIHFSLMIALAAAICWRSERNSAGADYFHDALLLIFAVFALTFFGHIGQVYQTSSPLWQPLLMWMVLVTPLLLLFGRSWLTVTPWLIGLLATCFSHAADYGGLWLSNNDPDQAGLYWGVIATPPIFAAMLAEWMRARSQRPGFWQLLGQLCLTVIIAGVSIGIAFHEGSGDFSVQQFASVFIQSAAMLLLAGTIYVMRHGRDSATTAAIIALAAGIHMLALILSGGIMGPALCFMLLWAGIAYGAMRAGWRGLFQLSVAILALRLIILSFELAYDLLYNGIGLIIAGLLTLGVAWSAVRVTRVYAPKTSEVAT